MKIELFSSDFDDFLKQDGLLEQCDAGEVKRVIAWQIECELKRRRISRAKRASRVKTNRARHSTVFSPKTNLRWKPQVLEQAALALGRRLKIELA